MKKALITQDIRLRIKIKDFNNNIFLLNTTVASLHLTIATDKNSREKKNIL